MTREPCAWEGCGAACRLRSSYCAEHHGVVYAGPGGPITAPREERVIVRKRPTRQGNARPGVDALIASNHGYRTRFGWGDEQ